MKKPSLFETLCANAKYSRSTTPLKTKKAKFKDNACFNKRYWADVESYVPALLCPIEKIEQLTGEPYDFCKHIEPLIKQGLIWIHPYVNCFPHSAKLRDASLKKHGLVQDKNQLYLQFFLGHENPNQNQPEHWL